MLVVMCLIGLIVGVSTPSISAGIDSVRLATATSSVAGFLNAAVTRVERKQEPIELVVEPQKNRIVIYSNEPGYTRELTMPEGVRITAVLPADLFGEAAGDRHVLIMPGSSTPSIGVEITNTHGTKRTIKLDPMTGFPRVQNGVEGQ